MIKWNKNLQITKEKSLFYWSELWQVQHST